MYWRIILNIVFVFIALLSFLYAVYLFNKAHCCHENPNFFIHGVFASVFATWLILMAIADKSEKSFSWVVKPTIIFAVTLGIISICILCKAWDGYQDYMRLVVPIACLRQIWYGYPNKNIQNGHDFYEIVPEQKGYRYQYNVYCRSSNGQFEVQVLCGLTPVKLELNTEVIKEEVEKYKTIEKYFEKQYIEILWAGIAPESHNCKFNVELNGQRYSMYSQDKFKKNTKNIAIWDHFPWEEAKKILGLEIGSELIQSE